MRSGKIRRCVSVGLTAALVGFTALGTVSEQAVSQDTSGGPTEEVSGPAYATDQILVKPEAQASADALDRIEDINGAQEEEALPIAGVRVAELPAGVSVTEAVKRYEADPAVAYAEPDFEVSLEQDAGSNPTIDPAPAEPPPADPQGDPVVHVEEGPGTTALTPEDPDYGVQWNLNNTGQDGGTRDADVDAPEAWGAETGAPETVVAVVDGGVDIGHPDLNENVWTNPDEVAGNGQDDDGNGYVDDVHGWNFVGDPAAENNDVGEAPADYPSHGHGTHVAGTIAAEGNNGLGVTGVAWGAKVMSLKFVGDDGSGRISDAMEALDYAIDEGAKISNHSWGCYYTAESTGCYSQALHDAIKAADASGHLLVTSAGNDALDTDTQAHYPSGYASPNVISVAATTDRDGLWVASNYGAATVDLGAPGQNVYSTYPSFYDYMSGTSMAAPHVAGVAALVKSANPGFDDLQIKERILHGVDKKDTLAGKTVTGGRLNAARALGLDPPEETVPASPTSVSLNVGSTMLTYGARTTVSGRLLSSSGTPLAGKQVVLEKRHVNEANYAAFAIVTTGSDGSFSGASTPLKSADYRARFLGDSASGLSASVSAAKRVNVKATVSLFVATTDLKLGGGRLREITGYVSPNHAYKSVVLTIKRNGAVYTQKRVNLDANSRYRTTFGPVYAGYYALSTNFSGDADHLGNTSPTKAFRAVN